MNSLMNSVRGMESFIPAKNFAESKRFYQALGFAITFDTPQVAQMSLGDRSFLLQNAYDQTWAESCMMLLLVDNVEKWRDHIDTLALPANYDVAAPLGPKEEEWGGKVLYVHDPSGVLWQIAQQGRGRPADRGATS